MKIEFIKHRHLNSLSRTVKPGEIIESSSNIPESLLLAYVSNGIAKAVTIPDSKPTIQNTKLPSGGE
jgi:hypothetical protein